MLHASVGLAGEGTTFAAVDIPALLSNARARHASTGTDIGTRAALLYRVATSSNAAASGPTCKGTLVCPVKQ